MAGVRRGRGDDWAGDRHSGDHEWARANYGARRIGLCRYTTSDFARAIAVESTRRTGELSFAPRERSDAPSAQPTWSQAVRLTRQAVCAWVDLLAGPPRVEVTAR